MTRMIQPGFFPFARVGQAAAPAPATAADRQARSLRLLEQLRTDPSVIDIREVRELARAYGNAGLITLADQFEQIEAALTAARASVPSGPPAGTPTVPVESPPGSLPTWCTPSSLTDILRRVDAALTTATTSAELDLLARHLEVCAPTEYASLALRLRSRAATLNAAASSAPRLGPYGGWAGPRTGQRSLIDAAIFSSQIAEGARLAEQARMQSQQQLPTTPHVVRLARVQPDLGDPRNWQMAGLPPNKRTANLSARMYAPHALGNRQVRAFARIPHRDPVTGDVAVVTTYETANGTIWPSVEWEPDVNAQYRAREGETREWIRASYAQRGRTIAEGWMNPAELAILGAPRAATGLSMIDAAMRSADLQKQALQGAAGPIGQVQALARDPHALTSEQIIALTGELAALGRLDRAAIAALRSALHARVLRESPEMFSEANYARPLGPSSIAIWTAALGRPSTFAPRGFAASGLSAHTLVERLGAQPNRPVLYGVAYGNQRPFFLV